MESWHLPNLSVQIAPDCISEYLNFQMPPDPPSKSRLRRSKWALSRPHCQYSELCHARAYKQKKARNAPVTDCVLFERYDLNQFNAVPHIAYRCCSLWSRRLWSIVSKAADRSNITKTTSCLLSIALRMSLNTRNSAVSVL